MVEETERLTEDLQRRERATGQRMYSYEKEIQMEGCWSSGHLRASQRPNSWKTMMFQFILFEKAIAN